MATAVFAPRSPQWLRSTLAAAAVALALYAALAWRWPWQPGRFGGLVFGTGAALLFVNAGLYPWRRRWRARPLGTARRWLELHVYGSALGFFCVLLHTGFRWPNGRIGWLLWLLAAWTTATGLVGLWLQRLIPKLLARRLTVEAIYERIPELRQTLVVEADALMNGASDALARTYAAEVRPSLVEPRVSLGWITGSTADREQMLRPLAEVGAFLDDGERARLRDLESIVHDKVDLDAQLSLQRILKGWLAGHVPTAIALLALLFVHVVAVIWF
jgi:hypothetical protein